MTRKSQLKLVLTIFSMCLINIFWCSLRSYLNVVVQSQQIHVFNNFVYLQTLVYRNIIFQTIIYTYHLQFMYSSISCLFRLFLLLASYSHSIQYKEYNHPCNNGSFIDFSMQKNSFLDNKSTIIVCISLFHVFQGSYSFFLLNHIQYRHI